MKSPGKLAVGSTANPQGRVRHGVSHADGDAGRAPAVDEIVARVRAVHRLTAVELCGKWIEICTACHVLAPCPTLRALEVPLIVKRTGALLIGWFVVSVVFLLVVEGLTLSDSIPQNHITAVVRAAWAKEPWVFLWLVGSLCYLAGHFFAIGRKN